VIYIGFAVGLLNTYLFTKQGTFTESQYGLTGIFIAIATSMMAFANLAMPAFIYKFFPYYNDNLPPDKNDQVSLALLVSTIGFVFVLVAGIVFKTLVVRKFSEHSPEVLTYYNWIFPFGFGLLGYTVLESYAWQLHKSVLTNFFREVQWRLMTTVLIALFLLGVIAKFDLFIKLYAFTYPAIAISLLLYLIIKKKIHFTFQVSKVTRRLASNILRYCSFLYGGTLVFSISQVFDSIIIASVLPNALAKVGIYTLAQNITSLVQAPQRGVIAASVAHLSKAWKDKNIGVISRIYQRSSLNQLIFSCGLYLLILLNFLDAIQSFHLKEAYMNAYLVFIILGATKIVDMGTGVNSQIISTSPFWRFELTSGIILLAMMLPLNYVFTKHYGIVGTAISSLISIFVYNLIRVLFLWKKFNLFPFTRPSFYTLLVSAACFALCYFLFRNFHGITGMILRSATFCVVFGTLVVSMKLTPDLAPVWKSIRSRLGIRG
jgi:O-antigen/teichoic acid export membrane protein